MGIPSCFRQNHTDLSEKCRTVSNFDPRGGPRMKVCDSSSFLRKACVDFVESIRDFPHHFSGDSKTEMLREPVSQFLQKSGPRPDTADSRKVFADSDWKGLF